MLVKYFEPSFKNVVRLQSVKAAAEEVGRKSAMLCNSSVGRLLKLSLFGDGESEYSLLAKVSDLATYVAFAAEPRRHFSQKSLTKMHEVMSFCESQPRM
jgi:hypothetical protein